MRIFQLKHFLIFVSHFLLHLNLLVWSTRMYISKCEQIHINWPWKYFICDKQESVLHLTQDQFNGIVKEYHNAFLKGKIDCFYLCVCANTVLLKSLVNHSLNPSIIMQHTCFLINSHWLMNCCKFPFVQVFFVILRLGVEIIGAYRKCLSYPCKPTLNINMKDT